MHIPRHKKVQIFVTTGLFVTGLVYILAPSYQVHAVVANFFSSMVWLWER